MKHIVLEARLGSEVKTKGKLLDAVDHYPSYFQVMPVMVQSYNIQPHFISFKYYTIRYGFPPQFKNLQAGL